MQENEFEKQVKNMMEDFNVVPSGSVWDKVSRKLNDKRRRKTPFIFFIIVGLATAGFFIYHISNQYQKNSEVTANAKNDDKTNNDSLKDAAGLFVQNDAGKQATDTSSAIKQKHLQYNLGLYNKEKVTVKHAPDDFVVNESFRNINNEVIQPKKDSTGNYGNTPITKENNNAKDLDNNSFSKDSILKKQTTVISDTSKIIAQNNSANDTLLNKDLSKPDSISSVQNKYDSLSKSAIKKTTKHNKKTSNWQWGITASYGRSNAVDGLINFDKSAVQSLNSPGSGTNNDTLVNNGKPYTSSGAYQFGFVLRRKIFKDAYISTGLNFVHLSTKSAVNQKIDSSYIIPYSNGISSAYSVNGYYQPGSFKTYKNTYNFIELPITFQQDLFTAKPVSFSYNAGISLRQLISSNALIYNQYNSIYFYKDDMLRKTQVQFSAGISLKFNAGKNASIYAGPQVSYSLSNLLKNDNSGNFHLINYGLQATMMFHKK